MMRCSDLTRQLDLLAPPEYACDWDNPGLLAGWSEKEVHRILVALDATDEVVAQAVRGKGGPAGNTSSADFLSR